MNWRLESAESCGQYIVEFRISEVNVVGWKNIIRYAQGRVNDINIDVKLPNCGAKNLDKFNHVDFETT